jgi:hypothetical protein
MTRLRWTVGATAAVGLGLIALAWAPTAGAQDDDPLDALRELVPPGFPGEYDLTEADAEFGELVEAYGETTEVADFGDGSELTGPCGGFAYSYDENGDLLDAAADLGDAGPPIDLIDLEQAFTSGNPFKVDTRGVVVYYGFAPREGTGPLDHEWYIKTSGISLDEGGDPNTDGKNRNAGLVDLDEDLPIKFSAKVEVEGQMMSDNLETCVGKGHVEFVGNGLTDPVGIAALVLLGGGIFGLLFNARPARTWKA